MKGDVIAFKISGKGRTLYAVKLDDGTMMMDSRMLTSAQALCALVDGVMGTVAVGRGKAAAVFPLDWAIREFPKVEGFPRAKARLDQTLAEVSRRDGETDNGNGGK